MAGLIGREQEIDEIGALLRDDGIRLVTITGPGGVGKTRLAEAASSEQELEDGVVHIPLASVSDPEHVLPAIARATGTREAQELGDSEILLVLDNVEHVAAAGPLLVELLAACPHVKLLATSRTRLRLSLEREFPLAPLPPPDCVALFVERARAVRPDLDTGDAALRTIGEVCASLDGLPLAIELAAARAKLLSPEALKARLGDRLGLLAGGAADLPERQQTVRATLDWSFELLGEDEQRLFGRLGAFTGGFTLDAAETVCDATLDSLAALVDSSLVQAGGDRFSMLETVRIYAEERVEEETRARHAAFFLALAEDAAPRLAGDEQAVWFERLDAEHANLRAALEFALDGGDTERALRFGGALWRFWLERGYFGEGRESLRRALLAGGDPELRARALTGASVLAHYAADYGEAESLCRESIGLNELRGDRAGKAGALEALALTVRTRGDFAEAVGLFEQALEIFRAVGDEEGTARTLDRLAMAVWFVEDAERAEALVTESIAAFRRIGNRAGFGLAMTDLGLLTLSRGDPAAAGPLLLEGLAVSQEVTDRWNVAKALYGLGDAARAGGDQALAASRYDDGLTLTIEYGFPWFAALFLERLAGLAGDEERAAELFGAAETVRHSIGAPRPPYFEAIYDRDVVALRVRLAPPELEAAWARGAAMTLAQAGEAAGAVRSAVGGAGPEALTGREVEVLGLVATGLTDAEIAKQLFVSPRTVHAHLRSIYRKLDVRTRSAATRYAVEQGLLQDR